ncbi:MAG: DUF1015 domain-containing protein [Candidatus Omnitrophica bacterium]|nr:DUF1015 domain-containing protein [Candidatus Omnitrophota bacterium]
MPYIKPFRGVVYNKKKVGNLSKVVSPPYDIIPKEMQEELYRAHPNNFVRLELGKIEPSDNVADNRYTRAKKFMDEWLKDNILTKDDKESIYIYSQKYKTDGKTIDRIGFIALMSLEEGKKKVLPHENTLMAPKVDRLDLMRSINANLSPIYVLYDDKSHAILKILKKVCSQKNPYIDIMIEGIRNRAWRIDSPVAIKRIQKVMRGANTFIADGHHRFEVTRMYSRELEGKDVPQALKESSRHAMVYFVESKEDMLTVLPAHRLPKDIGGLKKDEMLGRLEKFFTIEKAPSLNAMMSKLGKLNKAHVFGAYFGHGQFYILKLKSMRPVENAIKDKPGDWKKLDVAILHLFIFQHVLGIRDEDDNVEFVKSPAETAKFVDRGDFKAAFFLNPTRVDQIKRIAKLGEKMPRKATYFYPKPLSGIVVNKF